MDAQTTCLENTISERNWTSETRTTLIVHTQQTKKSILGYSISELSSNDNGSDHCQDLSEEMPL